MKFFFWKKHFVFFNFFFLFLFSFCIKFHISKSQIMYLLYFFIYYHFNMQYYPLFQLKNTKNRKNWIFSCLLCAGSNFFYEITLWCYVVLQKNFHNFLIRSGYLKFCPKKISPPQEKLHRRNFEKKKEKNLKIKKFGRSAGICQIFLEDKNSCIRRICCINIFWFEE